MSRFSQWFWNMVALRGLNAGIGQIDVASQIPLPPQIGTKIARLLGIERWFCLCVLFLNTVTGYLGFWPWWTTHDIGRRSFYIMWRLGFLEGCAVSDGCWGTEGVFWEYLPLLRTGLPHGFTFLPRQKDTVSNILCTV